jgi:hypothetical protein
MMVAPKREKSGRHLYGGANSADVGLASFWQRVIVPAVFHLLRRGTEMWSATIDNNCEQTVNEIIQQKFIFSGSKNLQ